MCQQQHLHADRAAKTTLNVPLLSWFHRQYSFVLDDGLRADARGAARGVARGTTCTGNMHREQDEEQARSQ